MKKTIIEKISKYEYNFNIRKGDATVWQQKLAQVSNHVSLCLKIHIKIE